MALSEEPIEVLKQKVRVGMTEREIWNALGEPMQTTISGNFSQSEMEYRTAEWHLTVHLKGRRQSRVTGFKDGDNPESPALRTETIQSHRL